MWQAGEEVFQITSSGGYLDKLLWRLCEFRIFGNYCTHSFSTRDLNPGPLDLKASALHCATACTHCVCECRSSAGVGAGRRDRVHTPCAMDHEGLLKVYGLL